MYVRQIILLLWSNHLNLEIIFYIINFINWHSVIQYV